MTRLKLSFIFTVLIVTFISLAFIGCNPGGTPNTSEITKQSKKKTANTNSLFAKQPTPFIEFSMDRYLQAERLTRFNNPNKMTYLYVCFPDGNWLQFTIVGKLASTSKRLTPPIKNYKIDRGQYTGTALGPAPDEMGVFGSSNPAKIGMTTLGSMFEIGGFISFIYSEVPLNFKNMGGQMIEVEVTVSEDERVDLQNRLNGLKKQASGKKAQ